MKKCCLNRMGKLKAMKSRMRKKKMKMQAVTRAVMIVVRIHT